MNSDVAICNMALGNIGAKSINSFSDSSETARICSSQYYFLRDLLLSSHPWGFNHKRAALSEIADNDGVQGYDHIYNYPSDALYINKIFSPDFINGNRLEYEVLYDGEQKMIGCNEEGNIYADYRARVTDVSQFPIQFCEALTWFLSSRLASALARDSEIISHALKMYQLTTATACQVLANEDYEEEDFKSSWICARWGLD